MAKRKRRIEYRLRDRAWPEQSEPMFRGSNIHYDVSDRARGLGVGGIGAMHLLARRTGLVEAIDRRLHLLKIHLPYHESDHVLNIAYNILSGGTCLEDIELRRNDEVYLDGLGTQRIPDPTTAGDFCRRFSEADVVGLMEAINQTRLTVWARQEADFFEEAVIDADGVMAPTTGQCKEGMDISHDGQWGYHPLVISLANTQEPLYLVNRSGNRPSHEGAAEWLDRAMDLCERGGFRSILMRGDTDFSQTAHLDRWDARGVEFIFGMDAMGRLIEKAEDLAETAWDPLDRPARPAIRTEPRARPDNVKERIVKAREFENIRLNSEHVAEFAYSPTKCRKTYRMVVLRKNLSVEKGEKRLFDEVRYFFFISNSRRRTKGQIVFEAHGRCDQENLNAQLLHGVNALRMPVDNLVSNWAHMVMASLAWTLKAWFGLWLPERGRWKAKHRSEKRSLLRMEFKRFVNGLMRLPCQVVRAGRRIVYRLLSWNPWVSVLLRGVDALRHPMRC